MAPTEKFIVGTFAVLFGSQTAKSICDKEASKAGHLTTDSKVVDSYLNDPMIQALYREQQEYAALPVFELSGMSTGYRAPREEHGTNRSPEHLSGLARQTATFEEKRRSALAETYDHPAYTLMNSSSGPKYTNADSAKANLNVGSQAKESLKVMAVSMAAPPAIAYGSPYLLAGGKA
ncbi:hypothetical protein QEH53_08225 [Pelagicoccus sp. SDUM812002]|nr:hypothetical protein [Pelagicoccus sp. SDUM812002]